MMVFFANNFGAAKYLWIVLRDLQNLNSQIVMETSEIEEAKIQ